MTLTLNLKGGGGKLAEHYANKNTAHSLCKEGKNQLLGEQL